MNEQLPCELDLPSHTPYASARKLPTDINTRTSLQLRASMQDSTVYIDNEELYHSDSAIRTKGILIPYASLWHFVSLPDSSGGRELHIELSSPTKKEFSGVINPVHQGDGASLAVHMIRKRFPGIVISLILLIIGSVFLILIPSVRKLNIGWRLFYPGLFAISAGIWIFSEMRALQIFTIQLIR